MATKVKPTPLAEQIKQALDGRTQRWLSTQIGMIEDTFSKKMRGVMQFSDEDIEKINTKLSSSITK